jgi:SRSO17 transposase
MDERAFEEIAATFAAFHRRFAPLFGRKEARRRSEQYVRGLLVQQTDRRNAENLAELVEGATPRAFQRLLTEAPWSAEAVIAELQAFLGERLGADDGVFVLDDSGFPKQGTKSVGVARQYSGTLGKVANCQVGVFLAYVSARGRALADAALYLPERWADDPPRCRAAGVPAAVPFQTKPALGLALLRRARERGQLAGRWVTADEAYGGVPTFRDALDAAGWRYVLEVSATTTAWPVTAEAPPPVVPGEHTRPRPDLQPPRSVADLAATLPGTGWQVLTVAEGAQGPRAYQFAAVRIREAAGAVPGRLGWALWRRNLDGSELKHYLSNAPAETPLTRLAVVASWRWPIETEFEQAKNEAGLDEYEVRSWQGWHHHITLALLANAFLLSLEQEWGGKSSR